MWKVWGHPHQPGMLDIDDGIPDWNPMYITITGIYALKVPISLQIHQYLNNFSYTTHHTFQNKQLVEWL